MKLGSWRFISPITLWLGNPGLIRSGSQTRADDPQGQSVHKVGHEALANFISPITLWLGNRMLSPSQSQGCERGPGRAVSEAFLRHALAIFISPITLWLGNQRLIRPEGQTRAGDPTLFHRSHFDWATGGLFVPRATPGRATRRPSVGVSVQGIVSKTLVVFISPITL